MLGKASPWGCARRRVSECNRRRRHLARRLKLSAKRTDEGRVCRGCLFAGWLWAGCPSFDLASLGHLPPRGKAFAIHIIRRVLP